MKMNTMTEQDEEKEIVKRIKNLEKKISKLEKESRIGLEDQLFFGVVISVALFVITLDLNGLTSFFQSVIKLSYTDSLQLSETIKNISIAFLISSSVLRYYGAIRPHKGARLSSFLCLIMGLDFFLILFVVNALKGFSIEVFPFTLPFSLIALLFIYLAMGKFIERRIIKFYAERGLVLKKYTKISFVSYLFADLSFALYCMLATQMVLATYFNLFLSQLQLQIILIVIFCVFAFLYLLRLRREKIVRF